MDCLDATSAADHHNKESHHVVWYSVSYVAFENMHGGKDDSVEERNDQEDSEMGHRSRI